MKPDKMGDNHSIYKRIYVILSNADPIVKYGE